MEVSEAKRLKKLLAEAMLDNAVLKDIAAKKWWRPPLGDPRSLTSMPNTG